MQSPCNERGKHTARDLTSLTSDLKRFRDDGGNIKRAKLFNNVIDDPMFNVPLDQVSHYFLLESTFMRLMVMNSIYKLVKLFKCFIHCQPPKTKHKIQAWP